jgi:hypothetical protein
MAGTTDSRAAGFDAAGFRSAIRFAMNMGLPNATSERATFKWSTVRTFATADPAGSPYDFSSTPTASVTHADVLIPVAVEFSARPAGSRDTAVGQFDSSRAVLTVLDEDYALVAGADLVLLGQNTYEIQFVGPPVGLFDVTIYQLFCDARDES